MSPAQTPEEGTKILKNRLKQDDYTVIEDITYLGKTKWDDFRSDEGTRVNLLLAGFKETEEGQMTVAAMDFSEYGHWKYGHLFDGSFGGRMSSGGINGRFDHVFFVPSPNRTPSGLPKIGPDQVIAQLDLPKKVSLFRDSIDICDLEPTDRINENAPHPTYNVLQRIHEFEEVFPSSSHRRISIWGDSQAKTDKKRLGGPIERRYKLEINDETELKLILNHESGSSLDWLETHEDPFKAAITDLATDVTLCLSENGETLLRVDAHRFQDDPETLWRKFNNQGLEGMNTFLTFQVPVTETGTDGIKEARGKLQPIEDAFSEKNQGA